MKKTTVMVMIFVAAVIGLLLTGCMSAYEYKLNKANADNAAKHQPTVKIVTIKGPMTLGETSEMVVWGANQPFKQVTFPSQLEKQAELLKFGAAAALLGYGASQIGDSGSSRIINNNAAEVAP